MTLDTLRSTRRSPEMLPRTFYKGDAVVWIDEKVPEDATAVSVWFRTNSTGSGAEATGVAVPGGWKLTLSEATTSGMGAGIWYYQAVAVTPEGRKTYDDGRVEVLRSYAYEGDPEAVDERSQAERDLAEVEVAIRTLSSGAQSYTIGTASGGRTFTRPMLSQLIAWRDRLLARVAAERQADGVGRKSRRILARID